MMLLRRSMMVLSLALPLAIAAIGIRSRSYGDEFRWTTRRSVDHEVTIQYGRIQHAYPDDPPPPLAAAAAGGLTHVSYPLEPEQPWSDDYRLVSNVSERAGFAHGYASYPTDRDDRAAEGYVIDVYPLWPFYAISWMAPLWMLPSLVRALRRARRNRQGQCPRCGYDLRATPDSCPECGRTALSKAQN
jgi:hypothetical protein